MDEKKASRPSQAGLPHKFEKFILKKLGTIFQPQRYSISSTPPNLQGYFFSNGRKSKPTFADRGQEKQFFHQNQLSTKSILNEFGGQLIFRGVSFYCNKFYI